MITVTDLRFGYRRNEPAIDGLSHPFPEGQASAVTGRSGSGKSTLLYLIGLLLSPWSGRITIAGQDVADAPDALRSEVRALRIGFVFQDAALDPTRTVLDNVVEGALYAQTPRREAVGRAHELLERFGVNLRADHRPGEVSGGQAQRVALCRALLNRPRIVLADEPTGNLDTETAGVVIDALLSMAHDDGATVIIVSHDPAVATACDEVLAL